MAAPVDRSGHVITLVLACIAIGVIMIFQIDAGDRHATQATENIRRLRSVARDRLREFDEQANFSAERIAMAEMKVGMLATTIKAEMTLMPASSERDQFNSSMAKVLGEGHAMLDMMIKADLEMSEVAPILKTIAYADFHVDVGTPILPAPGCSECHTTNMVYTTMRGLGKVDVGIVDTEHLGRPWNSQSTAVVIVGGSPQVTMIGRLDQQRIDAWMAASDAIQIARTSIHKRMDHIHRARQYLRGAESPCEVTCDWLSWAALFTGVVWIALLCGEVGARASAATAPTGPPTTTPVCETTSPPQRQRSPSRKRSQTPERQREPSRQRSPTPEEAKRTTPPPSPELRIRRRAQSPIQAETTTEPIKQTLSSNWFGNVQPVSFKPTTPTTTSALSFDKSVIEEMAEKGK